MDGSNNSEVKLPSENTVINTNQDGKVGQDKCPKCGATDISLNMQTSYLRCNYCRHEFAPKKLDGLTDDLANLKGEVIASGGANIDASIADLMTFKCASCGAEVVVDTKTSTQSKCHWCRNMLSINMQVANGAVPDVVLPFKVEKTNAKKSIEDFVKKRSFYANTKFKSEFTTENIMGVYLPYLVVDVNSHAFFKGYGEHQTRTYLRGHKEHQERYYDADVYLVSREYDLTINGLTIESSSDKLKNNSSDKTNNVINAIMPFDIENCVKFNSNYLNGFTSEKRDVDIDGVKNIVNLQVKDIARFAGNATLKHYDRGVRWEEEKLDIIGQQWKTAYLPVWLYSYQEVKGNSKTLHYVAVNARTNETMGSVPINIPKLVGVSCVVEFFGIIAMLFVDSEISFIFLFAGLIYYVIIYMKYRNKDERHRHEVETNKNVTNLTNTDLKVRDVRGVKNSQISGANNFNVSGSTVSQSAASKYLNSSDYKGTIVKK